jgi:hypothetical protein
MIENFSVGGEFYAKEFFQHNKILNKFKSGSWTLSGRSAFELIIKNKPNFWKKTIYLPIYNCPSIYKIAKQYFKEVVFYDLSKNLNPKIKKFKKNSVLMLVNYFGHKSNLEFDKHLIVIEDLSHSLLDKLKFKKNRIYFLSLRKFGIFNLGGWTNFKYNNICSSEVNFLESFRKKKFKYLSTQEKCLQTEYKLINLFKKEEKKIFKKKYCISQNQIKSLVKIPEKKIISIRKLNYLFLKKNIKNFFSKVIYKKNETPLFFFVEFLNFNERNRARKFLKKKNIYCPIFWDLTSFDLSKFPNAKKFSENILAIPIDHRLNIRDTLYVIKNLKEYDFKRHKR